jgi:putative phage-type endonuclease
MEDALTLWLLDNRPYTQLSTRIHHFVLFLRSLEPRLSYSYLKRYTWTLTDKLMLGDVGRLWRRDRCFERVLRLYGVNDQRTAQWHAKRGEMITASEVYKIFATDEARREIMLRKLEPAVPTEGSNPIAALLWGTRFEPVAKRIYEQRTNCTILDVSCVQHPRYSFLGASPDGLIIPNDTDDRRYGRLVEFKCPISRVAKDDIPIAYYHQMQMQMECTGIDECEYVEFRFKQVNYTEWLRATGEKGFFSVCEDTGVVYDVADTRDECQVIYWVLQSVKDVYVPQNPGWITSHIDELQTFWNEVLEHRKNGTLPIAPQKPGLPKLEL